MSVQNGKGIKISITTCSIIFLLVCQIIGFSFGYGALRQQVAFNRELIATQQATLGIVSTQLEDLGYRITKIETILNSTAKTTTPYR